MNGDFLTDSDILRCKYVDVKVNDDDYMVYTCRLCGIPCEDVMRCSDGCVYTSREDKTE